MKNSQKEKIILLLNIYNSYFLNPSKNFRVGLKYESGKNKFKGNLLFESNKDKVTYKYSIAGKTKIIVADEIISFLANEALAYDHVEISIYNGEESKIIIADNKQVTILKNISNNNNVSLVETSKVPEYGISNTRKYYIEIDKAKSLLYKIGIIDENNKLKNDKIRKYNQIDRFIENVHPVLESLTKSGEKITILDLACGKSYLSFVLYFYIKEVLLGDCEITGLDREKSVIDSSIKIANELDYKNISFEVADLEKYIHKEGEVDLCISLHACDVATDYAIFTAIKSNAKSIYCVPCCHKELYVQNFKFEDLNGSILKHGLLKERFSAIMTESLRILLLEASGYKASIKEYISPLDSPKNLLISAKKTNNKSNMNKAKKEYLKIKENNNINITLGNLLEKHKII